RGVPGLLGVVAALDVDGVGRAGPGAQLAADALLQPVRVPVELVAAVVARRGRREVLRVLLGDHLLEHRREGDAEALEEVDHYSLSLSAEVARRAHAPTDARLRRPRDAGASSTARRRGRDGSGTTRSSGGTG